MADEVEILPPRPTTAVVVLAIVLLLLGLVLAVGGGLLIGLGGSWYYFLAGVGLLVSGTWLLRNRGEGAWWFWGVLVLTFFWALWESGLDYWRWVPRLGLMMALAVAMALLWPRLTNGARVPRARALAAGFALVIVVAFALAFLPHGVTRNDGDAAPDLLAAPAPGDLPAAADWTVYGRDKGASRWSPLEQITPENVAGLQKVWEYRTGDLPEERWGAETTPLKIGNRLYLCTGRNRVIALDAGTGNELWRFDAQVPDESIPYTAACRGVSWYRVPAAGTTPWPPAASPVDATPPDGSTAPDAGAVPEGHDTPAPAGGMLSGGGAGSTATIVSTAIVEPVDPAEALFGDSARMVAVAVQDGAAPLDPATGVPAGDPAALCAERIVMGTLDARLIALDADTGQRCPGFGVNGEVDLMVGMGESFPGFVSVTSPPTIVRDVIVTGHQVLDGQKRDAPSGVIRGYDALTGALRWAWDMGQPELTGVPAEGRTYTRGTPNMWTSATGDDALGLVYLPMGNSAVDYWTGARTPVEDRYATSLVALDVGTGKVAWHFQTVHIDAWDYDLGAQGTLVDFPGAGGVVPAIVLPSKQGDIYVLDRRTGEPLTGVEERPSPSGGVEPERMSRTQPFSLFHTLARPPLTEQDMWGMTPIDQLVCRIQFRKATYQGMYTPPTSDTHWIQYPGYNGGTDWGGIAIDPVRGVIVANYNDMPNYNRLVTRQEADRKGWTPRDQARGGSLGEGAEGAGDPQAGTPYAIDVNAGWRMPFTGLLCKQPPYGGIRAIDLRTGQTLWDRPLGTARRNGPFGIPSLLPIEIGTPNNGGAALTGSGLAFIAAATDNLFRAIDVRTGDTLWTDVLPAGGQANPITYEHEGRQYVVIMAGGHHFMETPRGDHVIAYALPE